MGSKIVFAAVLAVTFAACGVDATAEIVDDSPDVSADQELSTTQDSFVIARHDQRKCVSPMCGGYWIKDLNSTMQERYVSAFDFSQTNLSDASREALMGAADNDVVLLGRLGPMESRFRTRTFIVSTGYRGMPGKTFSASDKFYGVFPSKIACVRAPCAYLQTTRLNRTTGNVMATGVDVSNALATLVDDQWLMSRVFSGKTVIAGTVVRRDGNITVTASQVFVQLPDRVSACPVTQAPRCRSGKLATFIRTPDRCTEPTGECSLPAPCANFQPQCDEGYRLVSWQNVCPRNACEPAFLEE